MSLTAAAVELTDGIKTLAEIWDETRAVWMDGVAQDFEQRFWRPLEGMTHDAVNAVDRLAILIAQVRRDCTCTPNPAITLLRSSRAQRLT